MNNEIVKILANHGYKHVAQYEWSRVEPDSSKRTTVDHMVVMPISGAWYHTRDHDDVAQGIGYKSLAAHLNKFNTLGVREA